MRWFLMRAHHLCLSCTNFGVASLSNFMGNRDNKSTPMGVSPSAKNLVTVFKIKVNISRLTNVTAGDSKSKNFWSPSSPHNRKKEETHSEYCYKGDAASVVRPPSVCIDDDKYVFLRILYSVVSEVEDKK
ncbi:hypothetical protein O3P69_014192 [Scylla paramamosain]|uniref:Uncharacterized protein n=1 Tax=Scylla paramamosain TaxID=85552 RepID=A0AAW0SA69_SCYPA